MAQTQTARAGTRRGTDSKAGTKRPGAAKAAQNGRKKSKLTQAGDEAKLATERALLLKTLKAKAWNLTHTAAELEMGSPTAVIAAIARYELRQDYEKARAAKRPRKQAS